MKWDNVCQYLAYRLSFVILPLFLLFLPIDLTAFQLFTSRLFGGYPRPGSIFCLPIFYMLSLPRAFIKLKQITGHHSGRMWLLIRDSRRFILSFVWVIILDSPSVFSCLLRPWVGLAMSHLGRHMYGVNINELVGLPFSPVQPYPSGPRAQLISPALIRNIVALLR